MAAAVAARRSCGDRLARRRCGGDGSSRVSPRNTKPAAAAASRRAPWRTPRGARARALVQPARRRPRRAPRARGFPRRAVRRPDAAALDGRPSARIGLSDVRNCSKSGRTSSLEATSERRGRERRRRERRRRGRRASAPAASRSSPSSIPYTTRWIALIATTSPLLNVYIGRVSCDAPSASSGAPAPVRLHALTSRVCNRMAARRDGTHADDDRVIELSRLVRPRDRARARRLARAPLGRVRAPRRAAPRGSARLHAARARSARPRRLVRSAPPPRGRARERRARGHARPWCRTDAGEGAVRLFADDPAHCPRLPAGLRRRAAAARAALHAAVAAAPAPRSRRRRGRGRGGGDALGARALAGGGGGGGGERRASPPNCPLDLFLYSNSRAAADHPNCTAHVDRGLLSAIGVSPVRGLALWDDGAPARRRRRAAAMTAAAAAGALVAVEALWPACEPLRDVVLIVNARSPSCDRGGSSARADVYKADGAAPLSISYPARLAGRVDGAAWLRGAARKRKRTAGQRRARSPPRSRAPLEARAERARAARRAARALGAGPGPRAPCRGQAPSTRGRRRRSRAAAAASRAIIDVRAVAVEVRRGEVLRDDLVVNERPARARARRLQQQAPAARP